VGSAFHASGVHTTPVFKVEVCRVGECTFMFRRKDGLMPFAGLQGQQRNVAKGDFAFKGLAVHAKAFSSCNCQVIVCSSNCKSCAAVSPIFTLSDTELETHLTKVEIEPY
jgi:hypothetical protein